MLTYDIGAHEFVFTELTRSLLRTILLSQNEQGRLCDRASEFCENKLVHKYRTKTPSKMKFVYYIQTEIFWK